jgi:putative transposase
MVVFILARNWWCQKILSCYFNHLIAQQLNPIEHLWQYLKADLRWASFKTLEELQIKVGQLLAELTPEIIASITGYPFILDALYVVNTI